MFDDVMFDDALKNEADKKVSFLTTDFRYYVMAFAFIGLGGILITKFSKK